MITFVTGQTNLLLEDINIESNLDSCINYCKKKTLLGLDTETTGLSFIEDKLLLLQIGDIQNQYVIDALTINLKPLSEILEDTRIKKVFHNVKFDYKFIKQNIGCRTENVYDTMLAEMVLTCGKPLKYGLKVLILNYLKTDISKSTRKEFIGNDSGIFTLSQIKYAAEDVTYLLPIREKQIGLIKKHSLGKVVALENKAVLAFADMEFNGLNIDLNQWEALSNKSKIEKDETLVELYNFILKDRNFEEFVPKNFTLSLFDDEQVEKERELKRKFNFNSPQQVLRLFQKVYKDLDSVDAKVLQPIKFMHSIIETYIKYKEKAKLYNAYGPKFSENILSDGKVHTSFKQIVATGRVSSSKPNMHQIPADNSYRNAFITNDDNWVFVSSDFSSQELCVIATGSNDPVWIEALSKGEDLHSVCASLAFEKKWKEASLDDCKYIKNKSACNCPGHKKLRTISKKVSFGLSYGMSAQGLSDAVDVPLKEAEDIIEKYFATFPKIKDFLARLGREGLKKGYAKTFPPFERIRWFDEWTPRLNNAKIKSKIERKSKNTPIQGTGADMTKVALVYIREMIIDNNLPVKLVMTVHDQVDTIVRKDFSDEWKIILSKIMEKSARKILVNNLLKAETEISPCWKK